MTANESANLNQTLQAIGWSDSQITNLILSMEGRISIQDAAEKHKELEEKKG